MVGRGTLRPKAVQVLNHCQWKGTWKQKCASLCSCFNWHVAPYSISFNHTQYYSITDSKMLFQKRVFCSYWKTSLLVKFVHYQSTWNEVQIPNANNYESKSSSEFKIIFQSRPQQHAFWIRTLCRSETDDKLMTGSTNYPTKPSLLKQTFRGDILLSCNSQLCTYYVLVKLNINLISLLCSYLLA